LLSHFLKFVGELSDFQPESCILILVSKNQSQEHNDKNNRYREKHKKN